MPSTARPLFDTVVATLTPARGWRRWSVAFAAGALSTLAMAPYFLWPILFVTLPVLYWHLADALGAARPLRSAAFAAWCFAFGYFFAGLLWIGEAFLVEAEIFAWLLPFAVTLLPAAMALYWALAGLAAVAIWRSLKVERTTARVLVLALALTGVEWLRGHLFTGFPWNALGLALTWPLPLMQSASVLGIYGLTLWTAAVCTAPLVLTAAAPAGHRRRAAATALLACAAPLVLAYGLGTWRLAATQPPPIPGVKVRIVQPSVPQRDKWSAAKQPAIFADHLALSRQDSSGRIDDLAGITHVIWPEASMPFGPLDHPEALEAIGQLLPPNTYLLAGALRQARDESASGRKVYNSLLVFGPGGGLAAIYDKIHLVPFGEYLPFQATLESIGLQSLTRQRGGFASGPKPKPLLSVPGLPPVAPLICYEAIFPAEVSGDGDRPSLIVIVTNDGWFGNSTGPPQHFHQARVRAVEQGITVVRSANNGISAVIDPVGRVQAILPLNARGTIDALLPAALHATVYSARGEIPLILCAVLFVVAVWHLRT